MKICILTPRFPFPENDSESLRITNVARHLKSKGHTLVLVSYCSEKDMKTVPTEALYDRMYRVRWNGFVSLGMSLWALLFNKPIQVGCYFSLSYLAEFMKVIKTERPDLYISHLLRMVPFLDLCGLQDRSIVEMVGAPKTYSPADAASGFSFTKIIYRIEQKRIAVYERQTAERYRKCVRVPILEGYEL